MTLAAILLPGPSLKRTWGATRRGHPYDLVIAVNRAFLTYHADAHWFVAADSKMFAEAGRLRPRHGWLTYSREILANVLALPAARPTWRDRARELLEWAGLVNVRPDQPPWRALPHLTSEETGCHPMQWSAPQALALAAFLGARQVHLFGADYTGATDCAGRPDASRTATRWHDEAETLCQVIAALGLEVIRFQPEADPPGHPLAGVPTILRGGRPLGSPSCTRPNPVNDPMPSTTRRSQEEDPQPVENRRSQGTP